MPELVTHWDPSLLKDTKKINSELHGMPGLATLGRVQIVSNTLRLILINTESVTMQGYHPFKSHKD